MRHYTRYLEPGGAVRDSGQTKGHGQDKDKKKRRPPLISHCLNKAYHIDWTCSFPLI